MGLTARPDEISSQLPGSCFAATRFCSPISTGLAICSDEELLDEESLTSVPAAQMAKLIRAGRGHRKVLARPFPSSTQPEDANECSPSVLNG